MIKIIFVFLSVFMGIGTIQTAVYRSSFVSDGAESAIESGQENTESSEAEAETDIAVPEENQDQKNDTEQEETEPEETEPGGPEQETSENETDHTPDEVPQLPETGSDLSDFVPEGWELLDSVELDFNEDGDSDYVGVLQEAMVHRDGYWSYQGYPRILFAIASDGTDGYRLDFQDSNLIRTRDEGGVFGDPYESLTAEEVSFTTHAYGGSAWRWSEDFTYTYREGVWRLTASVETYGYGDYITDYSQDDWESGVGIRKRRSSEWADMEENWEQAENNDWESTAYDLVYEVTLDEAPTLEQAGKRWWLAPDRVTDWEVEEIVFAADVEPLADAGLVKLPNEAYLDYCDENCVLYTFTPDQETDEELCYLCMYRWQDRVLSVLAAEESVIDDLACYKGEIYYSTELVENVTYRTMEEGKEQITEEKDTVGIRLNRMESDGTGKEMIFEYRYQEEGEISESRMPYLALIYEITGDEIIAEVYIGNEPHPFYRMKTDGSRQEKIGQVPAE